MKSGKKHLWGYGIMPIRIAPILSGILIVNKTIMSVIPSLTALLLARFVNKALEIYNGGAEVREIYPLFLLYAGAIVYTWVMNTALGFVRQKLSMKMELKVNEIVIRKRASLRYEYIEDDGTWNLISKVGENTHGKILDGFYSVLNVFGFFVEVVSVVLVLSSFVWWAPIPTLIFGIPIYIISDKFGKKDYMIRSKLQKQKRQSDLLGNMLSSRAAVEERTMFSYSKEIGERWFGLYENARKTTQNLKINQYIKRTLLHTISVLGTLVASALLLIPLSHGEINIGGFMALFTAIYTLESLVSWQLSNIVYNFSKTKLFFKDFASFMNLEEQSGALDIPVHSIDKINTIEFRHVSFKYPNSDRYVLKDLSMTLYGDRHYSFVGKNGAGKTTITKLLTGMYTDYDGEILINDRSLRTFNLSEIKGVMSVVYQDFARYEISLREEIALGGGSDLCTENEIINALKAVDMEKEIQRFENGLDTPLGKTRTNGTDVSGGQWQRIALARSLVSRGGLSILDEPTASLDPISEHAIYDLFGKMTKDKMTLFITHRLGAALLADEIFVIENGAVAEHGSHTDLIARNGIYAEMYRVQKEWHHDEEK